MVHELTLKRNELCLETVPLVAKKKEKNFFFPPKSGPAQTGPAGVLPTALNRRLSNPANYTISPQYALYGSNATSW